MKKIFNASLILCLSILFGGLLIMIWIESGRVFQEIWFKMLLTTLIITSVTGLTILDELFE